ncbi:VOC family protein [Gorillibacterium massiliense]|uniref:VOC family protein n=1 Tax=Gorillibacterium massiliense TaxID=1280390 RepID=UPI0004B42F50|nr:VOC family protein [Gorillibacterium massiliense]
MHFCWVTLRVSHMENSLAFYHEMLGLPISSRYRSGDADIAMLGDEDQPKIELIQREGQAAAPSSGISIGVAVDSLEEISEFLKSKGIAIVRGPISPNPHIRFSFVHDPDGYEVQLVENR